MKYNGLRVVNSSEAEYFINKFFYYSRTSESVKKLYKRLSRHYVRISRSRVEEILSHQEVNVLKKKTHRPDPSKGIILGAKFGTQICEIDIVS